MSQTYEKKCIYCQKLIDMSDKEAGKWLPFEKDGNLHTCKEKNGTKEETTTKKQEITLKQVQKKLESIGIIINLERLMKA